MCCILKIHLQGLNILKVPCPSKENKVWPNLGYNGSKNPNFCEYFLFLNLLCVVYIPVSSKQVEKKHNRLILAVTNMYGHSFCFCSFFEVPISVLYMQKKKRNRKEPDDLLFYFLVRFCF